MNRYRPSTPNDQPFRPYQSRVASLCRRFPHLLNLSAFLQTNASHQLGRIACLEFHDGDSAGPVTDRRLTLDELKDVIKPHEERSIRGRILILEDLTKEAIEILGSGLSIDPAFFAYHLYTSRAEEN